MSLPHQLKSKMFHKVFDSMLKPILPYPYQGIISYGSKIVIFIIIYDALIMCQACIMPLIFIKTL